MQQKRCILAILVVSQTETYIADALIRHQKWVILILIHYYKPALFYSLFIIIIIKILPFYLPSQMLYKRWLWWTRAVGVGLELIGAGSLDWSGQQSACPILNRSARAN